MNRDTKTSGGIISTNAAARQRWIVTAHDRTNKASRWRDLAGVVLDGPSNHKESTASRVQKDELDVQRIIDTLISWNNPFAEGGKQMPSLSSGVQATPNVQYDLLIR